jgi:hypothetical protein
MESPAEGGYEREIDIRLKWTLQSPVKQIYTVYNGVLTAVR